MEKQQYVDIVQTAGILGVGVVLLYVVVRLERALTLAADKIKPAIGRQQEFEAAIDRLHRQAHEVISQMQDTQKSFIPPRELRATLNELSRRLDQLEGQRHEDAPDDH